MDAVHNRFWCSHIKLKTKRIETKLKWNKFKAIFFFFYQNYIANKISCNAVKYCPEQVILLVVGILIGTAECRPECRGLQYLFSVKMIYLVIFGKCFLLPRLERRPWKSQNNHIAQRIPLSWWIFPHKCYSQLKLSRSLSPSGGPSQVSKAKHISSMWVS